MINFSFLGLVFLSVLLLSCLQLPWGLFLLVCRPASPKKGTSRLLPRAFGFISGVVACYFLLRALLGLLPSPSSSTEFSFASFALLLWLLLSAVVFFLFYFRSPSSTELWLPRSLAARLSSRARLARSFSDAFSLGFLAVLLELPFSLPPLLVINFAYSFSVSSLAVASPLASLVAVSTFLLPSTPLFFFLHAFRSGASFVSLQRSRLKNKPFFRLLFLLCSLVLALTFFAFISEVPSHTVFSRSVPAVVSSSRSPAQFLSPSSLTKQELLSC